MSYVSLLHCFEVNEIEDALPKRKTCNKREAVCSVVQNVRHKNLSNVFPRFFPLEKIKTAKYRIQHN